eukprot:CAMPEP_0168332112 /NCGR_PEP_ID=MMETSP0213-20121227/8758_1 /TAXON_ID=151035 /ORGANISM="Euplotes harpa, Strain FSP1.4" /LENGTH=96 /DNA_ID=CAMNT_0008336063 /DNA_START=344 /DNA_END=631 /DNA_ORIENTATION=+
MFNVQNLQSFRLPDLDYNHQELKDVISEIKLKSVAIFNNSMLSPRLLHEKEQRLAETVNKVDSTESNSKDSSVDQCAQKMTQHQDLNIKYVKLNMS